MSDDQSVSAVVPDDDELEAAFAPYTQAAGEVINAWNKLQEQFNRLFVALTAMPRDMATAIWHSARCDSLQRQMLTAALAATPDEKWTGRLSAGKDDIRALIRCASDLAEDRNDAIHAPVSLAIDGAKLVPIPVYFNGNPRAKRLKGKDILVEFRRCRDTANLLREFAEKVETALSFPSYAWPDKPALLIPSPKKNRVRNQGRQSPPQ
jgi:hypothetical protein